MWAFVAYSAAYALSFTINGLTGTLQDLRFSHLDHEFRFLMVVPAYLLIRHLKISQLPLWIGIISGALLSGGYALLSFFGFSPGERVNGSYHAIAFGDISLALAFMSIPAYDWLKSIAKAFRIVPFAALLLGMAAVLLSETRGAWIAIPALAIIIFLYTSTMFTLKTRILCLSLAILVVLSVYHIPAFNISGRIDAAFNEVNAYMDGDRSYSSIGSRIEGWQVALEIFRDHPVLGAGPGNYEPLMHRMVEQGKDYKMAAIHSQPHGAYSSALADCGTIGLLALLGLFAFPMVSAIRIVRYSKPVRHLGYALMILVVSFMHFGLTETIFSLNINVTFYIIFTATIMAVAANERENAAADSKCPNPPFTNRVP